VDIFHSTEHEHVTNILDRLWKPKVNSLLFQTIVVSPRVSMVFGYVKLLNILWTAELYMNTSWIFFSGGKQVSKRNINQPSKTQASNSTLQQFCNE